MWLDFGVDAELNHPLAVNAGEHWTETDEIHNYAPDPFPTDSKPALECLVWLRGLLTDHRYEPDQHCCKHISNAMIKATASLVKLRDISATEGVWTSTKHGRLLKIAFHPDRWGKNHPWAEVVKYFYQRANDFIDNEPSNQFGADLIRAINGVTAGLQELGQEVGNS